MSEQTPDSVDPRVKLARQRTSLATYRTRLALDRTTLAIASFGFGMVAFFRPIQERSPSPETIWLHRSAIRMGTTLRLLEFAGAVLAGLSHWFTLRTLRRGESPGWSQWPLSVTVAILNAVIGLLGLWELFA